MWAVKRSIRNLCDSVTGFFSSGDHMPWCDPNTIVKRCKNPQDFAIINILFHDNKDITPKASNAAVGCEREVSEAANGVSDELKSERIIRLSWALVHSKQPEDMQLG
ncbi:unnamed protein product [Camellia sinensis]